MLNDKNIDIVKEIMRTSAKETAQILSDILNKNDTDGKEEYQNETKDYILLPVIIVCAIGGTVGMLCTIQKLFPYAGKYVEKTKEWINKNQ